MRTILILRGLPGSGKTTYATKLIALDPPGKWIRINRDDLRCMLVGKGMNPYREGKEGREKLLRKVKAQMTRAALDSGYDVILDDTHLVSATVKHLHDLAEDIGDVEVIERWIDEPIQACIDRDACRQGFACVGADVINKMAKSSNYESRSKVEKRTAYQARPSSFEGKQYAYDPESKLPRAVICDLDGTLCLPGGRNPYDASTADQDGLNVPVWECLFKMKATGCMIFFVSGREEKYREPTERFLSKKAGLSAYPLFMRPTGDTRNDAIVKREIFEREIADKYNVIFVLDDRNRVVDMWRELGLTCFQVANGAF